MRNNFDKNQIGDLINISNFFQSQICNTDTDFARCLKSFVPTIPTNFYESFINRIDYKAQEKLYQNISESTFNEIWDLCIATDMNTKKQYTSLCAAGINGDYLNFLKDVGKYNPYVAEYAELVEGAGDFAPTLYFTHTFFNSVSKSDLSDPNVQLIIAIHILTIKDNTDRPKIEASI